MYSYEPAHQRAINACYSYFLEKHDNGGLSPKEFSNNYRAKRIEVTNRLYPQGPCRSRLFAFQRLLEEMGIHGAYNDTLKFEEIYWGTFISAMELCEDAKELLIECRDKGIEVCAVSDMQAHYQVKKLQALGVESYIAYLLTSEEVGVEKPDKRIFESALMKLSMEADKVVMVGDSLEKDSWGAQAIGIKGYLVNNEDV